METVSFRAMNTDILLAAEGDPSRLADGFERAQQFIRASEVRFTRFSEQSELSELNRSSGKWFESSPDMFDVLTLARRFYHLTRGLFDPSILPDLKRVGYDRSMDLLREQGAAPLLETLLSAEHASFSEVDLDETRRAVRLPAGMMIDLGGIAKGWIAEQAAVLLSRDASACAVNAGGDMFLVGLPEGKEQWPVALEDPLHPDTVLTSLRVGPGGVATSAITKRTWKQGEHERHHLIDPRTSEPAVTDWLSVTVISPHGYEAEVFAKALLIAGPLESEEITRNSGIQLSYLAVDRDMKIWGSQKSLEHIYVNTATF
ncbi:MAG TPA: FAD:protein FMN transferase [Anaerolineales bacterium]|nr:FAD:protein FMN transferase [Anaerolineales bacterium]